jgi:hypothetical protein
VERKVATNIVITMKFSRRKSWIGSCFKTYSHLAYTGVIVLVGGFIAFSHDDIYPTFSKIRVMRRKTIECLQQLCGDKILMAE